MTIKLFVSVAWLILAFTLVNGRAPAETPSIGRLYYEAQTDGQFRRYEGRDPKFAYDPTRQRWSVTFLRDGESSRAEITLPPSFGDELIALYGKDTYLKTTGRDARGSSYGLREAAKFGQHFDEVRFDFRGGATLYGRTVTTVNAPHQFRKPGELEGRQFLFTISGDRVEREYETFDFKVGKKYYLAVGRFGQVVPMIAVGFTGNRVLYTTPSDYAAALAGNLNRVRVFADDKGVIRDFEPESAGAIATMIEDRLRASAGDPETTAAELEKKDGVRRIPVKGNGVAGRADALRAAAEQSYAIPDEGPTLSPATRVDCDDTFTFTIKGR